MIKTVMDDLKYAILAVVSSAMPVDFRDRKEMAVPIQHLKALQAEYNIFFVEPEDKQLEVI